MTELIAILKKYNFAERSEPALISFEEIEKQSGFVLPTDYKYFLANYYSFEGFAGNEFIKLWSYDNLLENNSGYSINENLSNTLAIGSNGASEFIGIEKNISDDYRIILSPFIDLNADYQIEIGKSFSDMLSLLDNGKNWFD